MFTVLFTGILIVGSSPAAWGAQLSAFVNPNEPDSPFEMKYQKTIFIEYQEGGQIADTLRGQTDEISKIVLEGDSGVEELKSKLNQRFASDGSGVTIKDLNVDYSVTLTGRPLNTSLDYKLILSGTLQGYTIVEGKGVQQAIVDMGWRGMTLDGPVMLQGSEINLPINALKEIAPSVGDAVSGEALELLERPLIDATGIKEQPLTNWHFLFDPTGINVDANQFGLASEISGFVVSSYTMGESSIREGRQVERIFEADFTADKNYVIRTVQSSDNANLNVIGFAAIDQLEGLEIVGVTPTPPEGYATTSTGEFPIMIIYGMAGLAAVGGGVFFMFSNRALKKEEGMGQQGIDPSRLTGYQTSASSGGYQTNRGEAQLTDGGDYQQHRSVYDESTQTSQPEEDTSQSSRGSMPKGWKPE